MLLWLFVLNLGTAFGAGLYETRVVLPLWFPRTVTGYAVNHEALHTLDSGRQFWGLVTTLPLTLLTGANWWAASACAAPQRAWWLAAVGIALLERLGTFTFFIPTVVRLQASATRPLARVAHWAAWWVGLNYVRNGLTLAAWGAALCALAQGAAAR